MQAYPGRDPLAEVFDGTISLRKFRVMVEALPPGNPLWRARYGEWGNTELLLREVESRLRELIAQQANMFRAKGSPEQTPEYIPRPLPPDEQAEADAQALAMQEDDGEDLLEVLTARHTTPER